MSIKKSTHRESYETPTYDEGYDLGYDKGYDAGYAAGCIDQLEHDKDTYTLPKFPTDHLPPGSH